MSKPKTREELLRLLDAMHKYCIVDNWDSEIEQAYNQIKALIQNQPEVDEEKILKVVQLKFKPMGLYSKSPKAIAKFIIHQFASKFQKPEITTKDIEGWADEIRERVANHGDWSYLADGIKDFVEEEFGIKVKK